MASGGADKPQAQESWASNGPATNVDLGDLLNKTECYARNENGAFPWTNLFIGDTRIGCRSDADEQIILHFEFKEFVKLRSIKLTEWNNGTEPDQNPSRVLLFLNRVNLGFEDIEDVDPTTTLEITNEDLKENADNLQLEYRKYQRVKSITLFVEDNNGGEITSIGGLKFFGKPVAGTTMNDFKSQQQG